MKKPSIFISYAREDEDLAVEIYSFLKENNCDIWMDKFSLIPGQDWELEIQMAIENSDIFIACLTTNSVSKRGYVQKELKKALSVLEQFPEDRIFLIPIRFDNCAVPTALSSKHWLDWLQPTSMEKLKKSIELSGSRKKDRNSTQSMVEEIVKRETENWLSTGTCISPQRLAFILEKREEIPSLELKQAECIIMSLWDSHFDFDGWEKIAQKVHEEKIFEILHKWRISNLSNKYAPNGLRLFLLRILGNYRSDINIYSLGNFDEKERIKGIERLQKDTKERNILPLLYCLYDEKSKIVDAANQVLQRYSDIAIEPIINFARNEKNLRLLDQLIRILGVNGKNNVGKLIPFLGDNDSNIRWLTVKTLGEMRDLSSAYEVLALLQDPDIRIIISAIEALGKIKSQATIAELLEFFSSADNPEILQSLAWTFGQYNDEVFIQPLREMSLSKNLAVKFSAIDILTSTTRDEEYTIFQRLISENETIDLLIEKVKGLEIKYESTYLDSPNIDAVMDAIKKLCETQSIKAVEPIKNTLWDVYHTVASGFDDYEMGVVAGAQSLEPYLQQILDQLKKINTMDVELFVENFERESLPVKSRYAR